MSRLRLISCTLLLVTLPCLALAQHMQPPAPPKVKPMRPPKPPKMVKLKPKQAISMMEQQWRTATLAGDATQIDHLLSDDYVGISWNGQVNTKTSQIDRLKARNMVISKLDVNDVKVKIAGPVAIVTAQTQMDSTMDGTDVHGNFRYTRVYQQQPDGEWKITNFEATRVPGGTKTASVTVTQP